MNQKKPAHILALVLVAAMLLTMLCACTPAATAPETEAPAAQQSDANETQTPDETSAETADTEQTPAEPVKITIVEPGWAPAGQPAMDEKINEKLLADGMGIQIERVYYGWDVWQDKINLMLSTGEEFDLFAVMEDGVTTSAYYSRGGLADLSEAVDTYGAHIKEHIEPSVLDAARINGELVTIPAFWMEFASEGVFCIREDLLEQNGLSIPTNPEELFDVYETVQNSWTGTRKLYIPFVAGYDPIAIHTTVFHRTYEAFPFTVYDGMFYVDQNGTVKSWFETEEFKQDSAYMHEAYDRGFINPDVLTLTKEQVDANDDGGNWFVAFGTSNCSSLAELQKNNPDATVDTVKTVFFNPENGYLRPSAYKNSMAVSSTSQHVNEAVKFMDWLYTSQENYDLYYYGINGYHFTDEAGEGSFTGLEVPEEDSYYDSDWMSGNMDFERINVNNFTDINNVLYKKNPEAETSIASGFVFDATNVEAELANCRTEAIASMTPIAMGVLGYDEAYEDAIARMKAAGLDKVVAEFTAQFEAFLSSK